LAVSKGVGRQLLSIEQRLKFPSDPNVQLHDTLIELTLAAIPRFDREVEIFLRGVEHLGQLGVGIDHHLGCASLKATEQPIDTSTAAGKAFLDMLGVFAEFETNLRRERQLGGIADAKARGVYKGRKASIDPAKIKEMKAGGMGPSAIAKALKIGRASVYRALEV
jgi:DNA invertase Pin-like site-specific DNA recombinase